MVDDTTNWYGDRDAGSDPAGEAGSSFVDDPVGDDAAQPVPADHAALTEAQEKLEAETRTRIMEMTQDVTLNKSRAANKAADELDEYLRE